MNYLGVTKRIHHYKQQHLTFNQGYFFNYFSVQNRVQINNAGNEFKLPTVHAPNQTV